MQLPNLLRQTPTGGGADTPRTNTRDCPIRASNLHRAVGECKTRMELTGLEPATRGVSSPPLSR